ncbi:MAG TPA: hypothetical protein VGG39_36925 [Polyangiaceae bacterium]|jgi:hypothetical protein
MSAPGRPYRSSTSAPAAAEAPKEFVHALGRPADENADVRALLPGVLVGGVACAILARMDRLDVGLVVLVILCGMAWWRARRRASGVVLRVSERLVLVYPWRGARNASVVSFDDLHDVRLDTKAIHRAQRETRPGVFAPTGYSGSLEVDVARIAAVCAPDVDPIQLTRGYASHSEMVERIAKLKTFLRARGWVPKDERDAARESEDAAATDTRARGGST